MKLVRLLILLCLFVPQGINAQLMNIIGGPLDTIPCSQACKVVRSNHVKPLQTTSYQSGPIGFSPVTLSAPTSLSLGDDQFSGAIPISFPFCFYGNQYATVYISANGHITFNPSYSAGNCSFDTKQGIPFYNATYPDNAILSPFTDGNTTVGGTISYKTVGTAPFRKFVVQYSNIPFFGTGSSCTGAPATFQCVLNETMNDIDIFITNKSTCNADTANWLNYSTLGIQNIGASNFHVVNNRNASIWTASNEGWKISPSGPPAYSMNWFFGSTQIASNIDSINVCDPFPKKIRGVLTLLCPNKTIVDTILLVKPSPIIDSVVLTKTNCLNTSTGSATVYASAGAPPYTYSINGSPFGPSNVFTNLAYGQHIINVTDANGCTAAQIIFIGVLSDLAALIDSAKNPECPLNNGFLLGNASGGTAPYSYSWNPTSAVTQNIFNLGPGSYTLEVTDAQGCKNQVNYLLIWDSLPQASAVVTKPVCGDSTGAIDITISDGTAPYTYSWSNSATTQDLNNIYSGNYTIYFTDANGCGDSLQVAVVDTLNLLLFVNNFAHTTCGLNNGMGSSYATSGLAPYSFLWSNGDTSMITNTLASGWQYITVTDSNGCSRTDSLNLNPSVGLTINFLHTNAYCDLDNGIITGQVTGNTGAITYVWSNGDSTSTIDSLAAGTYILTATDAAGCVAVDTFSIINEGKPRIEVLQYIKPLCYGDSTGRLLLGGSSGTAPYKYSFDGVNFTTVALVTSFAAGTYKIYIRDANSCVSDTTIYFDPPLEIQISLSAIDTLSCYWDVTPAVIFNAAQGSTPYRWRTSETSYQANNSFAGFTVGANTIYVIDANGCETEFEFNVPGPAEPLEIIVDMKAVPCYNETGGELDVQITGGWNPYSYNWGHTTSQNLLQTDMTAGRYILSVQDDRSCQVDSNIEVVQNYCCDCYFPNAFTPNGDGNNETFRAISPATDIERYQLSVYNRWGARIFSTNNISGAWDGTISGEPAPIGTYFFKCSLKCLNKEDDVFLTGDLILVR